MVTRRAFLQGVGATACGIAASRLAFAQQALPIRVIAYNVYECHGWPLDRAFAKKAEATRQMPRRLAMELALYDPDIINFSESPKDEIALEVAELLGMHHVRFPSGGKWPGTLLSKFPVKESANAPVPGGKRPDDLFTRHWGRAVLELPGGRDLVVHSAHMMPDNSPVRMREVPLMLESMQPDLEANRPLILMGDLNHHPDGPEYQEWLRAGLVDTFTAVGQGDGLTFQAIKPERTLDYIFVSQPLKGGIKEARPLFEGAFRLNPDDPHGFALSDHLPQYAHIELR